MMQVIPMTIDQALTAADGYSSPLNGSMVDVLASEVRRLRGENERLRTAIEGWAQECSECDGTGQKWSGDVSNPDLSPCTDCADIRARLQP